MSGMVDQLLGWMTALPAVWVYLVTAAFAALENVVPPVPADVIALFGGFLAGQGVTRPWLTFLLVWGSNVAGAMLVYALGRRYGAAFFQRRFGQMLLRPGQLRSLSAFYERRGTIVIFVSRFLPMFRAVVPIFAGTSGVGWLRTLLPLAAASALWYGLLVYLGATAGANWAQIRAGLDASGRWLFAAAIVLLIGIAVWWWRTRDSADD